MSPRVCVTVCVCLLSPRVFVCHRMCVCVCNRVCGSCRRDSSGVFQDLVFSENKRNRGRGGALSSRQVSAVRCVVPRAAACPYVLLLWFQEQKASAVIFDSPSKAKGQLWSCSADSSQQGPSEEAVTMVTQSLLCLQVWWRQEPLNPVEGAESF